MVLLLVLLAAAPKVKAPAPAPLPEKWLMDWVDEAATPRFMASFHAQFTSSPHREQSEQFEMAARCYEASLRPADKLQPLLVGVRTRLATGRDQCIGKQKVTCGGLPERPMPQRARAAAALGCLRDAASVEALSKLAGDSDEVLAKAAIDALGFFGNRNRDQGFIVFGGMYRSVVFPPAPDPRATAALVAAFDASPPRRYDILRALGSHQGPETERLLQAAFAPQQADAGTEAVIDDLLQGAALQIAREQRCTRCVPWIAPLLEHATGYVRRLAAAALGEIPEPAAIAPLVGRLSDPDRDVRNEAQRALLSLTGVRPPMGATELSQEDGALAQAGWKARLGAAGERYDPAQVLPPRTWEPGVH